MNKFNREGLLISLGVLKNLKTKVENLVDEFILSNVYDNAYVEGRLHPRWDTLQEHPNHDLYNLMKHIWLVGAVKNDDFSISLERAGKVLGYREISHSLKRGVKLKPETLKEIIIKLDELIKKEAVWGGPSSKKIGVYRQALDVVFDYIKQNNIKLYKPSIQKAWYRKQWFSEKIKGYHIIKLLERNLGFDISFRILEDSIFKYGAKQGYARHHFREDPNRKQSYYVEDIILTDVWGHPIAEYNYNENQILTILRGFEKMVIRKGYGENGKITRRDITEIFGKENSWVYEKWFNLEDFDENLNQFNDRRQFLKDFGVEAFMSEYYKNAYNRFFKYSSGDGFYSIIFPEFGLVDYIDSYNFELTYTELFE